MKHITKFKRSGPTKVGYILSSPQCPQKDQLHALRKAGCQTYFHEEFKNVRDERAVLNDCITYLQSGDTLVINSLDRLGRNLEECIRLISSLHKKGIQLHTVIENIKTSDSHSPKVILALNHSLHSRITERINKGKSKARARGRKGGRKPLPKDHPKVKMAKEMHKNPEVTIDEICQSLGISRTTFYVYIKK